MIRRLLGKLFGRGDPIEFTSLQVPQTQLTLDSIRQMREMLIDMETRQRMYEVSPVMLIPNGTRMIEPIRVAVDTEFPYNRLQQAGTHTFSASGSIYSPSSRDPELKKIEKEEISEYLMQEVL